MAHNGWAGRVNYMCLDIDNPYKKKQKSGKLVKLDKKTRKKLENITQKQIENLAKRYKIK